MIAVTKTIYYITIIDVTTGNKKIHTDEEIHKMFCENGSTTDSTLFKLLRQGYLKFECNEDYELFGLSCLNIWRDNKK